jgi:hypothetical protein
MEFYLSVADSDLPKSKIGGFPLYFRYKEYKNLRDMIEDISVNGVPYAPSFYKPINGDYGFRDSKNFVGTGQFIILDVDNPGITSKEVFERIKAKKYTGFIMPSKNNNVLKANGIQCERFRVWIAMENPTDVIEEYNQLAKQLSKELCDSKDDHTGHSAIRYYDPSKPEALHELMTFDGINFPILDTSQIEYDDTKKYTVKNVRHITTPEGIDSCQKHIQSIGLKHIISRYNESNHTFNLHRNSEDKNPGCFTSIDNNVIRDKETVTPIFYSFGQILQAEDNSKKSLDILATETYDKILANLDKHKDREYNIVLTSEGLGKSSLVPKYQKIYGTDRVVLLCKSYDQLENKKEMYTKMFPSLKVAIIKGGEKFLRDYDISESEWMYSMDEETGDEFINLRKTIEYCDIDPRVKQEALNEIEYYEKIIDRIIKIDIILMVEEKLKVEVLIKKNFTSKRELIVWDEFHFEGWIKDRTVQDKDFRVKANIDKIFEQETWNEKFKVKMIESKNWDWRKLIEGKKMVLTTENIVTVFFEKKFKSGEFNIIDERVVFKTPDVHIWPLAPTLLRKANGNKEKIATGLRLNGFTVMGNGIQSKINNVSMKGQNYHDKFSSEEELALLLTQPSPDEIAPLMRNLDLDSDQATLLLMQDNLNQYIGRCNGFRKDLKVKGYNILIPNNLVHEILNEARYICPIKRIRDKNKKDTAFNLHTNSKLEKILFTMDIHHGVRKVMNKKLYLTSLMDRVKNFIDNIDIELIKCAKTMKNFWSYKVDKASYKQKMKNLVERHSQVIYSQLLKNKNTSDVLQDLGNFEFTPVYS